MVIGYVGLRIVVLEHVLDLWSLDYLVLIVRDHDEGR